MNVRIRVETSAGVVGLETKQYLSDAVKAVCALLDEITPEGPPQTALDSDP